MEPKKWYQKKRYIVTVVSGILIIAGAIVSSPSNESQHQLAPVVIPTTQTATVNSDLQQAVTQPAVSKPAEPANQNNTDLSNDNYYTNSAGNKVHSPAYSNSGEAPADATAKCKDGTYSMSQTRSGTCSHHGGVAKWL